MTDDEYAEAMDFFVNFEGVSKRAMNLIPKNTILAMKKKLDNDFVPKNKINEILKGFIKKETVDEKYIKISEVEKNYTPNDQVPEEESLLKKASVTQCKECGLENCDFLYDHEKTQYPINYCINCGANLHPPSPPKIKKKYETRPKRDTHPSGRYRIRNG